MHATRRQKRSTANIIPILGSNPTRPHARSCPHARWEARVPRLWPGKAALCQDPRPLDRMADVGGRTGDLIFPSADDFQRHSAPLPLQELSGLILVVVCLLDDPECHAAPVG